MDESLARAYRELWNEHWWWRARREVLLRKITQLAPPGGFRRILDVGCGDGLFFDDLLALGAEVAGVEPDPRMVSANGPHAARIHTGPFVGPATPENPSDVAFTAEEPFDLVLMLDVLEHQDDRVASLRRARELLMPDGRLLITVPAHPILWTSHDVLSHHRLRYTRATLAADATAAGLAPVEMRALFRWLFPVKLAVRVAEGLVRRAPRVPAVPPPLLNRAALALSRLDDRLLGRLPFGSSLLCVCSAAT